MAPGGGVGTIFLEKMAPGDRFFSKSGPTPPWGHFPKNSKNLQMAELLWRMQNWAEKVQFQAKFGSKKKKAKILW